ncbi:YceI family protein [Flavihumibacter solisilvae]|nr:YceI family protein [Flavihumibacter solisilvae]
MKHYSERIMGVIIVAVCLIGYVVGCTHDDEVLSSKGPDITRGEEKVTLANTNTTFDKAHSNVQWSTQYLGSTALLTGRFDNFGFNIFDFDESNAAGIRFEAWVWLNTVNTSEPGRDDGCLLQTFGTDATLTDEDENLAIIRSKSVELSTTDKGYNVKADLIFNGVTKEVTCKMDYDGKVTSGTNVVHGFSLQFQFLAKTDFLIASTNIGDNVDVKCNANFRVAQ